VRVTDEKWPVVDQSGAGELAGSFVTAKVPGTTSRFNEVMSMVPEEEIRFSNSREDEHRPPDRAWESSFFCG
jgi:hypothetical protein